MSELICIRGGGDLATGIIQKFWRAGFRVFVLDIAKPTCIRRTISLVSAIPEQRYTVEDVTAVRADAIENFPAIWDQGYVPVLIDPLGTSIPILRPQAVIDAIIAKKNLGTKKTAAPITIALGPGFSAPDDVDVVIETMRGHDLGRLIFNGQALPDTGTPGDIAGEAKARVFHAPEAGVVQVLCDIGSVVKTGQPILKVGTETVFARFDGLVRGMIQSGMQVYQGMKIADVDPRTDVDWHTISDKARCLGGAALEAYLYLRNKQS